MKTIECEGRDVTSSREWVSGESVAGNVPPATGGGTCSPVSLLLRAAALWLMLLACGWHPLEQSDEPAGKTAPPELGHVQWLRDHDTALASAAAGGLPLLLLFQEVPG